MDRVMNISVLAPCHAQVLAHRGVKQVQQFTSDELEDIRAAAASERQRHERQVQQRGLPAKIVRFALRQVGQRMVTAPLMLIPGVALPNGLHDCDCQLHSLRACRFMTSSIDLIMISGACRHWLGCLCVRQCNGRGYANCN
jgi:hypothetical protein